jgi:type IX secretion system PorP/SprF family membrane protein
MKNSILYILLFIVCWGKFYAQTDAQISLVNESPIFINPAQTGDMDGSIRAGINYRNQWNSVDIPFETSILYADFKISPKFLNKTPLGIGVMYFNDRIGEGFWSNNNLTLSVSKPYYIGINKILTTGLYLAYQQQNVNLSNLTMESSFNYLNLQFGNGNNWFGNSKKSLLDFGLGTQYQQIVNKKFFLKSGIGLFHILQPDNSLDNLSSQKLQYKLNFHHLAVYQYSKNINIVPSIFYAKQGNANSFLIGSEIIYALGRRVVEKIDLRLGMYYRYKDAMIYTLGINHDNFTFIFSYDFTTSGLSNFNNRRGGFEMTISYVNRMFKGGKDFKYILPGNRLL